MSGPAAAGAAAVALPARVLRAPVARRLRGRGVGLLDTLLYGRSWIALVGVLLAGIVFFNVDLLRQGRDIARTAERSAQVGRENARLRLQLARLGSSERIQQVAARRGLMLPAPGDVRYVRVHPGADARRAAGRIAKPGSAGAVPPAPAPTPQPAAPQAQTPVATQQPQQTGQTPAPPAAAPQTTPPAQTSPPPAATPPAAGGQAPGAAAG